MFEIIFIVSGITALFRSIRVKKLTCDKYSHVSESNFAEWKALNLKTQNMALISVAGYIPCFFLLVLFGGPFIKYFAKSQDDLTIILIVIYVVNLICWGGLQGYFQGKLKKMSRALNIVWP